MFYVYVLRSESTGKIYIGQTDNLEKRLKRHNGELPSKKDSYTYRNTGPWVLAYTEKFSTRGFAKIREKQLKSFRGREYIKDIINKA